MRKFFLVLLIMPMIGYSQNSDWKELQGMIDLAIMQNGKVYINRNYTIDKPLVVSKWINNDYSYFSIEIIGKATMWDVNQASVIRTTFTDAPALSIQRGRNILIKGVNFQGRYKAPAISVPEMYGTLLEKYSDKNSRDSRYSPFTAIAIDPFKTDLPPDGGYPSLKQYYRGSDHGGSSNLLIEDCTFNGFVIGAIISPNGNNQQGDSIKFKNIRIGTTKIGIAAGNTNTQANYVENIGAWGITHTLFDFSHYGNKAGGTWVIDGINIAGNVVSLVDRNMAANTRLTISNVFAESLGNLGMWSGKNDVLEYASINFRYIDQIKGFPDFAIMGDGVTIQYSTLRYYGQKLPIVFVGNNSYLHNIYDGNSPIYLKDKLLPASSTFFDVTSISGVSLSVDKSKFKEKNVVILYDKNNHYAGYGLVKKNDSNELVLADISPTIKRGGKFKAYVYKK